MFGEMRVGGGEVRHRDEDALLGRVGISAIGNAKCRPTHLDPTLALALEAEPGLGDEHDGPGRTLHVRGREGDPNDDASGAPLGMVNARPMYEFPSARSHYSNWLRMRKLASYSCHAHSVDYLPGRRCRRIASSSVTSPSALCFASWSFCSHSASALAAPVTPPLVVT